MNRQNRKSQRHDLQGTMTVFMGMTILMLLSIFFSLLEVVHYISLREKSAMLSKIGIESMFADYCRPLWDEYGVLAIDGGYGGEILDLCMATDRMESCLADNADVSKFSHGGNHLTLAVDACGIESYGLLTDDAGVPFMKECAGAAMYGIPEDLLDGLKEQTDTAGDGQMDWEDLLEEGDAAYQSAMEERQRRIEESERNDGNGETTEEDEADAEDNWIEDSEALPGDLSAEEIAAAGNPIEMVLAWKDEGTLKQVVPTDAVSGKRMTVENLVSDRTLSEGNTETTNTLSTADRFLFQYYLSEHMGSYTNRKERKGLSYELEYVIGAEDSDKANLAETVEQLLVFRGAMNLASLLKDGEKRAEVKAVAVALAGASVNPAVIKAVEAGVTAAWVYAESVLDIRTLLDGGKIAVVKTPADWTSDLLSLTQCVDMDYKAKESADGIRYQTYLIALLSVIPQKKIGLRALDVIEQELRQTKEYSKVKMDNFIYCATVDYRYKAVPVFGSLVTTGRGPEGYSFSDKESLDYTKYK